MFVELINSGTTAINSSSLIDKATGLKLLKVLASVKDLPSVRRDILEKIANERIDYESTRLKFRKERGYLPWWACETKNNSSSFPNELIECVEAEEGEEIEACGRVSSICCSISPLSAQKPCS